MRLENIQSRPPAERHQKRSPAAKRHQKRSPAAERHQKRSPAAERHKKRSPAAKRHQKRSPAAERHQKRSPAAERHQKRSPAAERRPQIVLEQALSAWCLPSLYFLSFGAASAIVVASSRMCAYDLGPCRYVFIGSRLPPCTLLARATDGPKVDAHKCPKQRGPVWESPHTLVGHK